MRLIEKVWFESHQAKWLLVPVLFPLSVLFYVLTSLRKWLFRVGLKSRVNVNCPVVVVGNISVGGNGKTPVVIFLVEQLLKRGVNVGVISRGYGGKVASYPYRLTDESTAIEAGDEPFLIFQRCNVPVVVGSNRIESANTLIDAGCDLIISDDGLQHYRLQRDYEFSIVDSQRLFGNGLMLPAGPLRELTSRHKTVNCVIFNGTVSPENKERLWTDTLNPKNTEMALAATKVVNLKTGEHIDLETFIQTNKVINAIAGIGNPNRFFTYLSLLGFTLKKQHSFVDHQMYHEGLFEEVDSVEQDENQQMLLMTEKDAVKCRTFAKTHWWYLPVEAVFPEGESEKIINDVLTVIAEK